MSTAAGATVFLFSDIEGSTRLWEQQPAPMADALARHDAIVRRAVAAWGGRLVKGTGDGIHATFDAAPAALGATLQLQRGLADAAAAGALPLAVRCGLHAGPSQARDADHFGPEVNRAARIMAVAHGGQVLLSQVVADVLAGALPAGVALKDLGSVRLKDLAQPERLWQVLAPPLRTDFPPLRGLDATPNNLAQQLNRFIGREAVLPALHTLLGQYRLVTLLGTGGIGKSRLAMQLGAELLDAYPDGVWCVELAPLHDGLRLPQAVASVLGVREAPGRPLLDALCQHVASRRLLLILDNCEHVLDSAATLAKALLQASAGLRVLATSREVLRVAGELSFPVPPLGLPAPEAAAQSGDLLQHEAVRLFVDRARSAQPTFVLDAATAPAVVAICRQLDGIALALELAAARVRTLPVQAIAERLRGSFALLGTRDATVAPRQRSLQLLIDWSHDLLAPEERVLYRRLAVFAGGWTLELAEGVCADGSTDMPPDMPPDMPTNMPAATCRATRCLICCQRWSRNHWWRRSPALWTASTITACSTPYASMLPQGWPPPKATPLLCAAATQLPTWPWPRQRNASWPASTRPVRWRGWTTHVRTWALRWTGVRKTLHPTPRAWRPRPACG